MRHILPALVLGALVGAQHVSAQRALVHPANLANTEGISRIGFPFNGISPFRYQQILGTSATPAVTGTIKQIAFRRDNDTAVSSGDYVAWNPDIDLIVSTSPRTTQTMSPTFAQNHGSDRTTVYSGRVNFPAQKKAAPGPTPFAYAIKLTTPFTYVATRGDLCMEIVHRSSDNTNSACFMDADSSGGGSSARKLGSGCPNGRNTVYAYSNWAPGAYSRILLYNATATTPALFSIGLSSQLWLGVVPLPFDLQPFGAPGCLILQSNDIWLPGATSTSGRWDLKFPMPNIPSLGGLVINVQFLLVGDTGAGNAAQISTSDGFAITLAKPMPGVPAVSEAHASGTTTSQAVLVQQGYGMVVELTF